MDPALREALDGRARAEAALASAMVVRNPHLSLTLKPILISSFYLHMAPAYAKTSGRCMGLRTLYFATSIIRG